MTQSEKSGTGVSAAMNSGISEGWLQKLAFAVTEWSERWFPDAFVFTALAVLVVAVGALGELP